MKWWFEAEINSNVWYNFYCWLPASIISPFSIPRALGRLTKMISNKPFRNHFGPMTDEEYAAYHDYSWQIILGPAGADFALFKIFENGLFTKTPLWESFDSYKKNGIDISFHFGSNDSIDTFYGDIYGREQLMEQGEKVYIIEDSGHQAFFDNQKEFIYWLVEDMKSIY